MSDIGHNSGAVEGGVAADRLRSIIDRHIRLEEEVKALRQDQKDIMTEAKSAGYCPKTIKQVIRIMNQDPSEREENEHVLQTYLRALGV
ncbi:DUF2312 domain-containing protein [Kozakia baliensis]|uniref:DUF2312 domain-containing protein n=1 Tax=Kozakia baliensis TaxID=153496 RepID=UPI00345C1354